MYYIKSKENPADLGTNFKYFNQTYQMLDDDSLFRNGPECLKMGIKEAVTSKRLIPIDKISLSKVEKDMAALEVVKLHQLVITENKNKNFMKSMNSSEAIDEETIEDTVACLLVSDNDAVEKESWMNKKTTGYRAQKATKTVRAKITQVKEFSKYLVSPMKKKYDIFFRSTMITFKAIRCWLKLKISKQAPKNWADKRKRIDDRITALVRNSVNTASVTELPDEADDINDDIYVSLPLLGSMD